MVVALVCAWWSYVTRARAWATPGFSQSQKIPSNMAPLFHSPTSPSSPKSTVWPKAAELSLSAFLSSITWAPFRLYLYKPSTFALLSLQDSLGGGFDSSQALVGELSQVGLWDRVLSSSQVASLARCSRVTQGSVAPWTENGVEVHGGATKDPGEPCSKHNRSSQWLMGGGFEERGSERRGGGGGKVVAISGRYQFA